MNRLETHFGIVATGLTSAAMTVEATSGSARTLRDASGPATSMRDDMRFVAEQLDIAQAALRKACERLDLQDGALCANAKKFGTE